MAQFSFVLTFGTFFVTLFVRDSLSDCIFSVKGSTKLIAPTRNLRKVPEYKTCDWLPEKTKPSEIRLEGFAPTGPCQLPVSQQKLQAEYDFTVEKDAKELEFFFVCLKEGRGNDCEHPSKDALATHEYYGTVLPNSAVKAGNNYTVGFNVVVDPGAKGRNTSCDASVSVNLTEISCSTWNIEII